MVKYVQSRILFQTLEVWWRRQKSARPTTMICWNRLTSYRIRRRSKKSLKKCWLVVGVVFFRPHRTHLKGLKNNIVIAEWYDNKRVNKKIYCHHSWHDDIELCHWQGWARLLTHSNLSTWLTVSRYQAWQVRGA